MLGIGEKPFGEYFVLLNEEGSGIYFGETGRVRREDHDNRKQSDEE